MKNFKKHIQESITSLDEYSQMNEAKFSNGNMQKVSDLLASIASKKLGAKFVYAWTDNFKKSSGPKGTGIRYVSNEGLQIRFNHTNRGSSFAVDSVDFWNHKAGMTEPSLSLYFAEDINIVKLKEQLFDVIIKKKPVAVKLNQFISEGLVEAARDDRMDFLLSRDLPKSSAYHAKKFKELLAQRGLEAEWSEWVQVKKGDSEKSEFDDAIRSDEAKLVSSDKNFYANPKTIFQDLEEAAKVIASGLWRSLVVCGQAGVGKTYGIKQVLQKTFGPESEGLSGKWVFKVGEKASVFGVFKTLLLNKHKIVVYDDSDSIWRDKDIINLLKAATADEGDRYLSWGSGATANVSLMSKEDRLNYEAEYISSVIEDPNTKMKPPSRFLFEGSFINISNMPSAAFAKGDLAAISSRSIFIDLYLAERDMLRRIATIMEFQGRDETRIKLVLDLLMPPKGSDAITGKGKYDPKVMGEINYMTPEEARKNKTINMRSANIANALLDAGIKDAHRMVGLYA